MNKTIIGFGKRIYNFIKKCGSDNLGAFAAQSAFFIILSLIPFLVLFISLIQYTNITQGMLLEGISKVAPTYFLPAFVKMINEMYQKRVGILSVSVWVAIWSSGKGMLYLMRGLQMVYEKNGKQRVS